MHSRSLSVSHSTIINQIPNFYVNNTIQSGSKKKVTYLLQCFQPCLYGNDIVRCFDVATSASWKKVPNKVNEKSKESSGFVSVLNGFKMKLGQVEEKPKELIPNWKRTTSSISKVSISSRTRHILASILTAESDELKIARIEELCKHILTYPLSKSSAVQDGAIRLLLAIRSKSINNELKSVIGEAFAILGYIDPLPGRELEAKFSGHLNNSMI